MHRLAALVALVVLCLPGCSTHSGTWSPSISGQALVGPTCPVERDPPEPQCADRPYQGDLAVLSRSGDLVKTFRTDANGTFALSLDLGTYTIGNVPGSGRLPRCSAGPFTLVDATPLRVAVSCDSGIR
jgi:hypothetical protein